MQAGQRIGIGHDTHRLEAGGPLRLGGITIDHDRHLVGHSDADALLHAITDALLGAAALGDIGDLYPDTDPANQKIDSAIILIEAWRRVQAAGYRLANLDCIIFAQSPKLGPHKAEMARQVARLLDVEDHQVNVKAKTGERVGPVGREEALQTECIVLLESIESP